MITITVKHKCGHTSTGTYDTDHITETQVIKLASETLCITCLRHSNSRSDTLPLKKMQAAEALETPAERAAFMTGIQAAATYLTNVKGRFFTRTRRMK